MKARTFLWSLALCVAGTTMCFAQSPQMGTWKLNEAKSKIPAGATKNTTVVYAAAGDEVKVTTDGTNGDGKPVHTEWTGKFDGKDYPLGGNSASDARAYTKVDDHTLTLTNKKGGKVTSTAHIVVSADGKSRTVHLTGTDSAGKNVTATEVFDKQ